MAYSFCASQKVVRDDDGPDGRYRRAQHIEEPDEIVVHPHGQYRTHDAVYDDEEFFDIFVMLANPSPEA